MDKKIKTCIEKSEDVMQLPKEINVCRIIDHILCTYLLNHFSRVEGMSTAAQNTLKLGQRSCFTLRWWMMLIQCLTTKIRTV